MPLSSPSAPNPAAFPAEPVGDGLAPAQARRSHVGCRLRRRQLVLAITLALCFGRAGPVESQFTALTDRSRAILEGNWQSCREPVSEPNGPDSPDGGYAERIYDGETPGIGRFELHLGPHREFALFRGIQDAHRDHASPDNLLKPHIVLLNGTTARQKWTVAGLVFEVALAGGSRDECESWWITLRRADPGSSH
jgi:hypothetical protein